MRGGLIMEFYEEDTRNLSPCETMIMRIVWDCDNSVCSIGELRTTLKERFNKDYSRTTVSTFVLRLIDKGFIKTHKVGRNSFVHAIKSEQEYKDKLLSESMDFWYKGKASNLISALYNINKLTKDDIVEIRGLLDELDS